LPPPSPSSTVIRARASAAAARCAYLPRIPCAPTNQAVAKSWPAAHAALVGTSEPPTASSTSLAAQAAPQLEAAFALQQPEPELAVRREAVSRPAVGSRLTSEAAVLTAALQATQHPHRRPVALAGPITRLSPRGCRLEPCECTFAAGAGLGGGAISGDEAARPLVELAVPIQSSLAPAVEAGCPARCSGWEGESATPEQGVVSGERAIRAAPGLAAGLARLLPVASGAPPREPTPGAGRTLQGCRRWPC